MLPQTHSLSPPSILTAAATTNFFSPNPTLYSIKPFTITQLNPFNKTPHFTSSFKPLNFTASIASLSTLTPHIFCSSSSNLQFSLHTGSSLHVQRRNLFRYRKLHFHRNTSSSGEIRAVRGHKEETLSPWDEKPYELSSGGKKVYFDEQDIVSFLDPPKELIPLDRSSYNPAAYLWKKIDDIPEERRHRLLHLLNQRLTSRVWEIAGMRYEDSKLAKKSASNFLTNTENIMSLEFWNCRTSGGPIPISWMNFFKKVIFRRDGQTYGRILVGGPVLGGIANSFSTLYFTVREHKEVMSTEQPCDLAYEFGDGLLDLHDYPQGFPKPVKHPWPFNDHVVVYVRHVGPGVLVGQAWQEGKQLEQVPKKLCGEILMVKDY